MFIIMENKDLEEPVEPSVEVDETPLKAKTKKNYTPEQRQALSERMKKINAARIEKARLLKEEVLKVEESKLKDKMEKIEEKKKVVKGLKEKHQSTVDPPQPKVKEEVKAKDPVEKPKPVKKDTRVANFEYKLKFV